MARNRARVWIARGLPADRPRIAIAPPPLVYVFLVSVLLSCLYRRSLKSGARVRARNVFFAFQPSGRLWLLSLCTRAYARTQSFLHLCCQSGVCDLVFPVCFGAP